MSVPKSYLQTVKNLKPIMDSIQKAGVPSQFSYEFLKQLGFSSSGDRPIIKFLKELNFLDDGGKPTDRYKRFKDPAESGAVIAEALREAYSDLFTVNEKAHESSAPELKGAFARITGSSESVAEKMAMTFRSFSDLADYDKSPEIQQKLVEDEHIDNHPAQKEEENNHVGFSKGAMPLHHDIHIHLPVSNDVEVYDAIFRSINRNLMR